MNAKCLRSKLNAAFSLIELMVVIAIVALLTAIAVPSYQGYLQQSKVTEIFSLASDQMNQWEQKYNLGGAFNTPTACTAMGTYVACTELTDSGTAPTTIGNCPQGGANGGGLGVVCVQLVNPSGIDASLDGLTIYFTPVSAGVATGDTTDTSITWSCNFVAGTSNDTTAASLLSPGGCTAL